MKTRDSLLRTVRNALGKAVSEVAAAAMGSRDGRMVHVGLSWFLSDYAGYQTVYHRGGDIGYQTNFVMVLDAGVAVIVLSNYWGPDPIVIEVSRLALELAMGSEG